MGQVVFDADCGFCTRSARWIQPDPISWQSLDLSKVGATAEQADSFVGYLEDGRIRALGAPAIAASLRGRPGYRKVLGVLLGLPLVRSLTALAYPVIARNRHRLPGGTAACEMEDRP